MRPFNTPLAEVSTQVDLDTSTLVEFRARSFYNAVKDEYPKVQRLPMVLVADPSQLQNLHVAAYRFFREDNKGVIQVGPRMMTVNALTWEPGYEAYRDTAFGIMEKFRTVNPDELVMGCSIGFYNRIPAADLAEAQSILRMNFNTDEHTQFDELSYQSARSVDIGSVLMQVAVAQPDERMREKHLMVNNIIRRSFMPNPRSLTEIEHEWRAWFEQAHELAKDIFWNSLTPEAQASWKATAPA